MKFKYPEIEDFAIPLPITEESRQIANNFAATQPTVAKAEQVLLNTIAVKVVDSYLQMLGIDTDLGNSDSWNRVIQLCSDVADLHLPAIGTVECRPIKDSDSNCQIPLEVWDLRIGYLVVKINDNLKQAAILGFTPQVNTEYFAIANLQPPEAFLDCIHGIKELKNQVTHLGQWLQNISNIEILNWQAIDTLLTVEQLSPAYGFRNSDLPNSDSAELSTNNQSIARAKLIDLGVRLGKINVILLVEVSLEKNNDFAVTLRVYPQSEQIYLPEGLKLQVLEQSDEVFLESQARSRDNYIQLQFSGQVEEMFTVAIIFKQMQFSEKFKL